MGKMDSTEGPLSTSLMVTGEYSIQDNMTWTGISLSDEERMWLRVGVPVVYSSIVIIGLIGNGLVITVLMKYNNMKTIPNIYILNLAIMDFMFVLTLPFQAVQASSLHWPFGWLMCKLVTGYDSVNMFASVFTLSFMSVDRYVAVVYPISSIRYRTKTKTRIFCCLVWFSAILLALPSWLYFDIVSSPSGEHCYTKHIKTNAEANFYCYFNVMLGFILPLLVILTAYTALLYKMLRSNLPLRSDGASAAQRASKRVSILTISVIVVFFICWMPYHALQIAFAIGLRSSKALRVSNSIVVCWCYSNSCFNPLVYTFIGENFKKNLADMCPWCFPRASKFDRNRGGRESSTYTRGGTMRLNNVHYNEYTSPTVAPSTTVGSDGCNNDHSPKMQTYTFTT